MIINTITDLDFYKMTMGQLAFERFDEVKVKYAFTNRTAQFELSTYIDREELQAELNHAQTLQLTDEEGNRLQRKAPGIFTDKYINFLKNIKLPDIKVVVTEDNQFEIESEGFWKDAIYWETIVLSIVNELYYKYKFQDHSKFIETGTQNTMLKYAFLSNHTDIPVTDFGTRRRFSAAWQDDVISIMKSLPNFVGTSNVKLALKYDLKLIGTNAHELYMIATGMWNDDLRGAHSKILDEWFDMYGEKLSIALTDTFGTKSFFEDFGEERAKSWVGVRHDSGDPFEFGDKTIEYYKSVGVDPKTKTIVFSDGLNLKKIEKLYNYFNGKIKVAFGWGTHLTNDMGAETLSIVMKAVEVISVGDTVLNNYLVKLSDNLNKAMGPKDQVDRFKTEFGYTNTDREDCVV
ncbi:MAG: Nicotinate phosphoribosyltransferase [uncultured marine phage]|uniref:nicotinate phosphoribosyltransferase n=1 Tax=uncultured marine phage TaxID=707152 RepID=A0A8D9C9C0_9VIRU|nr:MAG: Nicotinate phosphoribosyltransferase [uncultured marine phage]